MRSETIEIRLCKLRAGTENELDFISCPELGLYISYKDTKLVYRLIEPVARFLMWANRNINVRPQTLDTSVLKEKGIMIIAFEVLSGKPNLNEVIEEIERHGTIGEHADDRVIFMPYADGRAEGEQFYHDVALKIRELDPMTR